MSDASQGNDSSGRTSRRVALIVAAANFMQALDSTIITTAMPAMAHAFHVQPADMSIGITTYMLALAAVTPISGWLSDRLGARNVFAAAVLLFTISSVLCGMAHNLPEFIGARALQGIGGSLMGPVGRVVILRTTPKKDIINVIALIVWPALAAPIIGPALGGVIVTYASWPWIFLVNAPLGLAGVLLVLKFIPQARAEARSPFDAPGLALASAAMVATIGGLELVGHADRGLIAAGMVVAGALLAWAALSHFARTPHPLIPLYALKVRTFAAANLWGGTTFRMTVFATPFLLPLMFQVGFGLSPISSGLLLLGYFAGNLGIKPFTTFILKALGFRTTLVWNGLLAGLMVMACAAFTHSTPHWLITGVLVLGGAFRSMQFTCLDSLMYCDMPEERRTGASTLWGVLNQIGAVLGVASASLLLSLSHSLRGAPTAQEIDFRVALFGIGVLSLLSLPDFIALPRDAGAEITGKQAKPA